MDCCNKQKLERSYTVILGIRFPSLICTSCFEVFDDVHNPIQKFILKILNPFWGGKIEARKETARDHNYRGGRP